MATAIAEPKSDKIDGIDKWEVEGAAETLSRAFEIKAKPKLLNAALKVIRRKRKAETKVLGWAGAL